MTLRPAWADVALGAGVVGLAAAVGWQTTVIPTSAIYAKIGPTIIPWIITAMLAGLGLALMVQGARGGWAHEGGPIALPALAWLLLGLIVNVAAIEHAGFILASTALFVATARAFGSLRPLRDAAIGFALALVAYVGFDRVLGYKIGSGLIESLF